MDWKQNRITGNSDEDGVEFSRGLCCWETLLSCCLPDFLFSGCTPEPFFAQPPPPPPHPLAKKASLLPLNPTGRKTPTDKAWRMRIKGLMRQHRIRNRDQRLSCEMMNEAARGGERKAWNVLLAVHLDELRLHSRLAVMPSLRRRKSGTLLGRGRAAAGTRLLLPTSFRESPEPVLLWPQLQCGGAVAVLPYRVVAKIVGIVYVTQALRKGRTLSLEPSSAALLESHTDSFTPGNVLTLKATQKAAPGEKAPPFWSHFNPFELLQAF